MLNLLKKHNLNNIKLLLLCNQNCSCTGMISAVQLCFYTSAALKISSTDKHLGTLLLAVGFLFQLFCSNEILTGLKCVVTRSAGTFKLF